MKKIIFAFAFTSVLWGCKTATIVRNTSTKTEIQVSMNLDKIKDDKVMITIDAPIISTDEITYHIPKMVPGTYSEDNYGRYIEGLKAYDNKGNLLPVKKTDDNSWTIANAQKLRKVTYLVNDTFDTENGKGFGKGDIFSPAGSNIEAGKNIMLNTHCFVGYFTNYMSTPYRVSISHPAGLWGATSMLDQDPSATKDVFVTTRYAELVENPIMYAKPDYTKFVVDDMEILIAIYSPNGKVTAENITAKMKTMMTAQKHFLGNINTTKKYSVLIYLTDSQKKDATGYGALEHPTATTVVMPEMMGMEQLAENLKDIVSHEFFHIVTPLTVHSQEIQNFDYINPKMSEHLWMYEGVTEYFANLFQINQGLITEEAFYNRIAEKIERAKPLNDTMPFTTMSANVLVQPYKDQYLNVYQKGALIGMCLDIIIRENSNGKRGILDLMQKLSKEYGALKAFNDHELFAKITQLTYPEVGEFLKTYVSGSIPIPYTQFLEKVGVGKKIKKTPSDFFLKGKSPYINVDRKTKEIIISPYNELSEFYTHLGLKGNDILLAINDTPYTFDNIFDMISASQKWKENDAISVKIKREGKEQILKGTVKITYEEKEGLEATKTEKVTVREAWLKG
jgi:predicted metalloprotease with PDZ domain